MQSNNKVTLQINLAPGDYPHARHILPHQLNALAAQVDEILLVVDTKASKGRFAANWAENKGLLNNFLEDINQTYPVDIIPVDYSAAVKQQVANYFFGGRHIPDKDYRGGPFYAYFFGLFMAKHNYVFHLDSDIFLGGGSQTWVAESIDMFQQHPDCFVNSPLPGPPHPQETLLGQRIVKKIASFAFQLEGMSTRLFMADKARFQSKKLALKKPNVRSQLKAIVQGNPNAQLPEVLISDYMRQNGLIRIDFLGGGQGMWSLHPPYRTDNFYADLPQLIQRIEENNLPPQQQGFYDIINEVCDWTEAREKLRTNRWWKRKNRW
ncbi:glycosyltransferase family A protein [Mucilaginibacter psychrotolerans]|uniref:Glycosyltransferase family 2 protein n=1 Tax=Mucilaginibacter psychrotolerans TaxID=1524096 RepID=A0A4Y8SP53_9SPHI|nr:glycosyltransferase family A protein [Mucilaginibacter psychrotolerans]TFF40859.1 glycosyltransferase family 2 protein [Mucilaginibacter psychrotolerans]